MLEVAREEPGISPSLASCIADAAASAERLIGMVGDLLDVSRMESGGLTAEVRPIDLIEMTITGVVFVAGSPRRVLRISSPVGCGIRRSRMMRSGCSERARLRPSRPVGADMTT